MDWKDPDETPTSRKANIVLCLVGFVSVASVLTLVLVCVQLIKLEDDVVQIRSLYGNDTSDMQQQFSRLGAKLDRVTQPKFQVSHVTPVKFQAKRGTCWDFTTLGILEQTYRRQGAEKGWLNELEYVMFSEHAYGVAVIEYCRENEAHCPHVKLASNSTDGGYVSWIYYFQPLQKKIVPDSVCPYVEEASNDHECEGYHEYLSVNPLQFNVHGMRTMYDPLLIKEHLRINRDAMAWVSILGTVTYYVPCTGTFENTTACNETKCLPCPLDLNYPTKCCIKESRAGWNLDGEFYSHREMEEVGAHAMTLVGYNDEFVSRDGHRGGFIVKNSWGAWHSHSLGYFMNEVSQVNEDQICPNSRNPRQWEIGKTLLLCVDTHYCDDDVIYLLKNIKPGPDETVQMCFKRQPMNEQGTAKVTNEKQSTEECSPPMPLDLYADFFEPVFEQVEPNDEDSCGHFFFPYAVLEEITRKFGFFWVSEFDIEWLPQSYSANQAQFPQFDYKEVTTSTARAFTPQYPDALPFFPPEDNDEAPTARLRAMAHSMVQTVKPQKSRRERAGQQLLPVNEEDLNNNPGHDTKSF